MSEKKTQLIGELKSGGQFKNVKVTYDGDLHVEDESVNTILTTTNTHLNDIKTILEKPTTIMKSYEWSVDQTDYNLWIPTLNYFYVTNIFISQFTAGIVKLFDHTDTAPYRLIHASFVDKGGLVSNLSQAYKSNTSANNLKLTATGTGFISIIGYEKDT